MESLLIAIYFVALTILFGFGIHGIVLLHYYRKTRKQDTPELKDPADWPVVTVQLPMFNELYVVERLIKSVCEIDYPQDKLEIQVLDDSIDETQALARKLCDEYQKKGFDISYIHRVDRSGYKAGALKEGLVVAKGEFVAIFDADFVPNADFLKRTVPHFQNKEIGMVQTRWEHINGDQSYLTKAQAIALDGHFVIEQQVRNKAGFFINFNGTAGIWRKKCVYDAGNWEGDTLTEDLDLSYRAQLKNWKFKYLENVVTPAELPVIISAARSQQFRWNKGGAENFQKMLGRLFKSKNVNLKTKIHGALHLLNSSMFTCIFLVAVLSIPMLYIKNEYAHLKNYFLVMSFFITSSLIFFVCYWFMFKKTYGGGFLNFIKYIGAFFAFFSIAMGFSFHNTIAVLEGHFGKKSEFVRTPKFNIKSLKDSWKNNKYIRKKVSFNVVIEGLLTAYFAFGMYSAFIVGNQGGDFGLFPFHLMLCIGFGYVFFKSLFSKA